MPMPNGTYRVAQMGDKPVGGIFPISGPEFKAVRENRRFCSVSAHFGSPGKSPGPFSPTALQASNPPPI
jgi:hypothetical protein